MHTPRGVLILVLGLVTLISATAASSVAGAAERTLVVIEARQWTIEPAGGVLLSGNGLVDTLDLDSDLGLEEDDALEGRVTFRPSAKTMIRASFTPELALAGDNIVSRSIQFLGQTFGVQSRVVTALDMEYGRLAFAWQGLSLAENRFRLGPIVEVKGFRGELALGAPDLSPPISEREEFEAAFGTAGLILDYELSDRLELFGESTVTVTGDEGDLVDTEYGVRLVLVPALTVVAGVRTFSVDIEDGTDRLDFELDGPFVGVSIRF